MSEGFTDERRLLLSSLARIGPLYPYGIPQRYMTAAAPAVSRGGPCMQVKWGGPAVRLAFVHVSCENQEPAGQAEEQLLQAAVERGMNLPLDAVEFLSFSDVPAAAGACLPAVSGRRPRLVIALGLSAARALSSGDIARPPARGGWFNSGPLRLLATHELKEVLANRGAKREFWEDLKLVLAELAKDTTDGMEENAV